MRRTEGCAQMRTSYSKFLQDLFTYLVPLVLNKIAYSVFAVISNDMIKSQCWCHLRAGPERSRKFKGNLTGRGHLGQPLWCFEEKRFCQEFFYFDFVLEF